MFQNHQNRPVENDQYTNESIDFVCPYTHAELVEKDGYFFSPGSNRAFTIIEGIPNLDPEYSVVLKEPLCYN